MTAEEYVKIRKDELDTFLSVWNKGASSDPGNYPVAMDEGDWYEQELAHNSIAGRE